MHAPRERCATADEPTLPPSDTTRARMVRQRRRDTKPELALRKALHARGWRYRVDKAPLPKMRRRADMIFGPAKVAVFVDGCFWHSCPAHATVPKNNRDWWIAKLAGNVARDRDTDARLATEGWRVVRIWEHEPVEAAVAAVEAALPPRDAHSS